MNWKLNAALGATTVLLATQAVAQVTFYEGEGFRGRTFATDKQLANLERYGYNDRASSVVVDRGRWEVCSEARFEGTCVVLRRGSYDTLRRMGLNDRISSVRPASQQVSYVVEPEPLPAPTYEFRRRPSERIYDAPVTSVRAIVGPPEQRCWIERQQVTEERRGEPNVGGAILGGIIGGVLGHQVGSGRGNDAATAGGAVAGALIGSNQGRGTGGTVTVDRDVERCRTMASTRPEYWDVTYHYRGVEHRVQMTAPPGNTIAVNGRGEPRV